MAGTCTKKLKERKIIKHIPHALNHWADILLYLQAVTLSHTHNANFSLSMTSSTHLKTDEHITTIKSLVQRKRNIIREKADNKAAA